MSKHRNKHHRSYTGPTTRQQAQNRQFDRELREAQNGIIDESTEEIAKRIEKETIVVEKTDEVTDKATEDPASTYRSDEKPVKWYVIDTNLILSCVDAIGDVDDEEWREPEGFKPKLDNAHLIIPKVVFNELNHMKDEISFRGMTARKALKRLTKFIPNSERSLDDILNLKSPIETGWGKQTISILPLHKNFYKVLPWVPEREDNDGWIAVTALAATLIREGYKVDESLCSDKDFDIMQRTNESKDVTLLTNDNALLSDADSYGVRVKSYSFKKRPIFTGYRDLVVPPEMFKKFYYEECLTQEDFERYLPNEPALVANEYIIMNVEDEGDLPPGYFTDTDECKNIARFHKKNGKLYPLRFVKHEGKIPPNAGIAMYYDAMNDDKIHVINVTGKAGTGKTYQAIIHAIKEVKAGRFVRVVLIPSKSAKNPLGALPGNKEQKMEPLEKTAKGAIRSYLASTPEFRRKRELLLKHGDTENEEMLEEENGREKEKKGKDGRNGRSNHDSRRTRGNYTGSYEDLDRIYELNDISPEDYGDEGHSKKKKNKAFYQGKSEKGKDDKERKMTYSESLEHQVNYIYSRYFVCIPYEEAQGDSYEDSIIIIDEAQRIKTDDADTILSRPAKNSKVFVMGDISQIQDSSPEKQLNNALIYSRMLFGDWDGCANIHLIENMRSDIAEVMTRNRDKIRRMMGII